MKNARNNLFISFVFWLVLFGCERPQSPDFKISHAIEGPFSVEATYQLLGGSEALIDTTAVDYRNIFSSGRVLTVSKRQRFDLSGTPTEEGNRVLSEATMRLRYLNSLPLSLDLTVLMLDKNNEVIIVKENVSIDAAAINEQGYVAEGGVNKGQAVIRFTRDEIQNLEKNRSIEFRMGLKSPQQTVKLRAEDSITFRANVGFEVTSTIN